MKLKHLDKIDMFLVVVILSWVIMFIASFAEDKTVFWWMLGFNCIFIPYTGVLLHNQMK